MSQLRAAEARPERQEGGRHGRPGARSRSATSRPRAAQHSPQMRLQPQLLRAAVLPAGAAVLSGAAAVTFTVRSTGARSSIELWTALGGTGALAVAAVLAAYLAANRVTTTVFARCLALRRASAQSRTELQRVVEQLRNGEPVPARKPVRSIAPGSDAFELLEQEIGRQQEIAVAAVMQVSQLSDRSGEEQKVEVFVNLARRLQSLVHREIQLLDELEREVEDPDLLKGLFHVDHLATRIRRHAENLAVLGGAVSRRQWSNPVSMTEVMRSAIAEVEQYPRVKLVPPIDGTLRGHAVADVIHLLAELVENATVFSAPHTQVLLRAQQVTAGLALEVEDRGLGMPGNEQKRMNALLADPDQVDMAHLLQDGRIGLFVVASLARRHGIAVRLQSNIYGGTQAVLVLPQSLLGVDGEVLAESGAAPVPPPGPVHRPPAEDGTGGHRVPNPGPGPESRTNAERRPYVTTRPVRLHQPPQQTRHQDAAPPLPLRTVRLDRPDPAEARPGTGHADDTPTTVIPRSEAVGTTGRPQLPKRAHQENLAPQLRQSPVPRPADEQDLHDPGLVAAFRRGIELAEARSESEADAVREPGPSPEPASPQIRKAQDPPGPLPVRGFTPTTVRRHRKPAEDPHRNPALGPNPTPGPNPAQDPLPIPDAAPAVEPLETHSFKE
ncbi:ATP-binding protein [Streptomyces sp. NPDC052052]|uniref:sensor histidine kinase n=1 Tax=Streptomyces sp. NPDC052052 TaxID=3154756 RepID=UPI0034336B2D